MIRRKMRLIAVTGLVFVLVFGLAGQAMAAAQPPEMVKVLIGFDRQPGPAEEGIVRGAGGKIKYNFGGFINSIAATVPKAAIDGLQRGPRVTYVELDGRVYIIGQTLPWGVDRIDAEVVYGYNKGTGVKVAILDTGIDYTHEDLDANYKGGYDFVNTDTDPMDDRGHGTHVAGTVAAEDNDIGVVGVAPEAALYALKVLDETGGGYWSDVIAAIEWSVTNGMQVINMSFGGTSDSGSLHAACDAAYASGVLLLSSAGNSGNRPGRGDNITYPAKYSSVIAVAATDRDDARARWSSTGADLELSAPGVSIYSTLLDGGYGEKSGTSMASPHVAGVAALVIAGEGLSNIQVRNRLQQTADDLGPAGFDTNYGYGLVDADEAAPPAPPATGTIAGTVTDTDTGNLIEGATVTADGYSTTTEANGTYTLADLPVGSYTVTASATGYTELSKTADVQENLTTFVDFVLTLAVTPTGTMSVDSISFSAKKAGPNLFLYTTVKVVLFEDGNVDGARVEMTLTCDDTGKSWDFAGDTGTDGTVTFTLRKAPSGGYTAEVTLVSHLDYDWDGVPAMASCTLNADGTVI